MNRIAEDLIRHFNMTFMGHESIYFTQTYASDVLFGEHKPVGTAIIALVTDDPDSYSDMHKLPTDEVWHFYLGDPIELLVLHPDGTDELRVMGHDVLAGQLVQTVVPADSWMGARVKPGGQYGLFGTTMAPGFTPDDFVPADVDVLQDQFPHHASLIRSLIRSA